MVISTREVARAQDQLEAAVADLDDDDLRVDTACPGWSRGHVLTHIARNAEGIANLARWALHGEVVPMYAPGRRDADIDAGATRPADDVRADLAAGNALALDALGELEGAVATDPLVAERVVRLGEDPDRGTPVHARRLPLLRAQEVVLHHHDLGLGLQPREWPDDVVAAGLPYVWTRLSARMDDPPTLRRLDAEEPLVAPEGGQVEVTGSGADLFAWLTGRADDEVRGRLRTTPPGTDLPSLPAF